MSIIEERKAYLNNPFFTKPIYGNFTSFYITIGICTTIAAALIIFNIICCCCSKHRRYWQDRHTGNRWLVAIWSVTPHKQPPLDLTELKDPRLFRQINHVVEFEHQEENIPRQQHFEQPSRTHFSKHHQKREEYVELQKRESDI